MVLKLPEWLEKHLPTARQQQQPLLSKILFQQHHQPKVLFLLDLRKNGDKRKN
jgi:hypothetical protein